MARTVTVIQGENGGEPSFSYSERGDLPGGANYRATPSDYVEDSQGQLRHIMTDVELNEEAQPMENFSYEDTLIELHGGQAHYQAMCSWATQNWDPIDVGRFDTIMNSGDNAAIEDELNHLAEQYNSANGITTDNKADEAKDSITEESEAEEFLNSLDEETIDATIDHLFETEITDDDASMLSELSENFPEDSVHHFILEVGQMVAAGELTMSDAIDDVIDTFGEAVSTQAYFQLQQLISN